MEPQSDEELQRRPDAIEVTRLIARTTPQRSACLDVGSGNGAFSYHLQKQGFKPTMIDLDPRAEDAAARIPGSTFRLCPFEDIAGEGAFSCIMMSQTLEHAIDPLDWLRRARRLLTSGGVLSVSVPNFGGLYKILGERDPFLTPPIHLNFFTAKSLTLAMQSAGLRVVKMRSQSRVAIAGTVGKSVAAVWNQFARLLGPTSRGIVLICLAQPE
jgi:2-polyprenyl-3-methyl-5-hydroxy-6-metoxy-1,4-benzoquinol methylase